MHMSVKKILITIYESCFTAMFSDDREYTSLLRVSQFDLNLFQVSLSLYTYRSLWDRTPCSVLTNHMRHKDTITGSAASNSLALFNV